MYTDTTPTLLRRQARRGRVQERHTDTTDAATAVCPALPPRQQAEDWGALDAAGRRPCRWKCLTNDTTAPWRTSTIFILPRRGLK
jgi:hypothetical protein